MSNKGKRITFILGATAGATFVWFLTTEEGRKWRKETVKQTRRFKRRVSEQAQEQLDYFTRSMDIFIENKEEVIQEITEEVMEQKPFLETSIESNFQRGMKGKTLK